ncbi:MAG: GspH/FimT family pseudopilin [Neptuniibacter sp.]
MDVVSQKRPAAWLYLSAGFTLLELISSLAIMSILIGVALPFFSDVIDRQNLNTDSMAIRRALSYARMAAITRQERIIVCHWDGTNGCSGNSARYSYQWSNGLLIFNDPDENKTLNSEGETVLRVMPFTGQTEIYWGKGEVVAFRNDGQSPGYNSTFTMQSGDYEAKLILSMTGRLRNGK